MEAVRVQRKAPGGAMSMDAYVRYRTEPSHHFRHICDAFPYAHFAERHLVAQLDMLFARTRPPKRSVAIESRGALRVLVVDDDPVNRLLATSQLLMFDIVARTASDGLEAVLLSREQDFDVILMDIDMPVMDGISAAALIRDHQLKNPERAHCEVVAFTAGVPPEEALLSHVGMSHVLRKPCGTDEIHRCLSRCCSNLEANRSSGTSPSDS